jgi:Flp pilus assembly protein TadD
LGLAQTAQRAMPGSPRVADTLGWAYYQKGIYGLAIDVLEGAAKKAPQNATLQYHLGLAYEATHDRAQARLHLERALQLDPSLPQAARIRKTLSEFSKKESNT